MDTKIITHLRNLADAIAMRPEKTGQFFDIVLQVITSSRNGKNKPQDDPFVVWLKQMKKDLGDQPGHKYVQATAEKYAESENVLIKRSGETLIWGLKNRSVYEEK